MAAAAMTTSAQDALDLNDSDNLLPATLITERDRYSELPLCSVWQSEKDKTAFVAIRNMLSCLPPDFVHPWSHPTASFEVTLELLYLLTTATTLVLFL